MKNIKHQFGIRVKELRESEGLSQRKLAEEINVTSQTISAWEKGLQETDFDMLIAVAQYFEVSVGYILGVEVKLRVVAKRDDRSANSLILVTLKKLSPNMRLKTGQLKLM